MRNKIWRVALPALVVILGVWLLARQTSPRPESLSRQEALLQMMAPAGSGGGGGTAVSSQTDVAYTMDPVAPTTVDMSQVRIDNADPTSQYNRWLRGEIDLDENEGLLSEVEMARLRQEALQLPPDPAVQTPGATAAAAPVPAGASFESLHFQETGNSVPPDPELAAGPDHLIAVVNVNVEIYDKSGNTVLGPTAAGNLFGQYPCTGGLYDPNVLYDEEAGRWFLAYDQGPVSASGGYCVLVSHSDDPLGLWNEYFFPLNDSSAWVDFPHAGVGDEYIVMGANLFTVSSNPTFVESRIYALDKAAMYNGQPVAPVVKGLDSLGVSTPQPLNLHGANAGTWPAYGDIHYILTDDYNGITYPLLRWDIAANTLAIVNTVNLGSGGATVDVLQNGGNAITANDWRILDFEYRNGYGWTAMTIGCNPGSGTVNCLRWAQIEIASGTLGPAGSGVYGSNGEHRIFPDLAADQCGNMVVGYTKSSSSSYPGVWYTGREAGDPAGTLGAEAELKAGEVPYLAYDDPPYRWGDYTGMTIDPDGSTFWYLGEYSRNSGVADARWGNWIGSLTYNCASPSPDFTLDATPNSQSICIGIDALYEVGLAGTNSFSGDVSLAAPNAPGGTAVSFSQNPAPAPATVTMTLDTSGGTAGAYAFDLVGTAVQTPTLVHTASLSLDLQTVPVSPTLLTPADGAAEQPAQPALTWDAAPGAVSYTVDVATDAGFTDVVVETAVSATSYQIETALAEGGTYFWRVTGRNACGAGLSSSVFTFQTEVERQELYLPLVTRAGQNRPPFVPSGPIPGDGADGLSPPLTLSWQGGDPDGDAVTYDLYLEAGDATPDQMVAAGLTTAAYTPSGLADDAIYYWRVTAADASGASSDGPVWQFRTAAASGDDFAAQVAALVNAERDQVGCSPLAVSSQLTAAAERHSADMALNDFFNHTGSDGSSPWDRIQDTGYQYSMAAENIAAGDSTPEDVMDGWMNSDGHRANILNCDLEEIGVSYYYLDDDQGSVNYHHYWTQVFAAPR